MVERNVDDAVGTPLRMPLVLSKLLQQIPALVSTRALVLAEYSVRQSAHCMQRKRADAFGYQLLDSCC